ncbi:prepilin peptidase [Candidatus Micrarchaeota archaeon]|nr:prepilin peptidase [Candidatus Micrarchaeota archaeon]
MIYFAIALFFFIIASFADIKKHEVPQTITYTLLIIGLFLHAAESFFTGNAAPFVWSAGMSVACFAFSYALYRLGVWAGGDVKLFTALGAILPYYGAIPFFPFVALASSLIAVFPVVFIYVLYNLVKVKGFLEKTKGIFMLGFRRSLAAPFIVVSSYFIASSAGIPLASLAIAPLIYFMKKPGLIFAVAVTLFSFYTGSSNIWLFASVFSASVLTFTLLASYSAAKKHVLRETKRTSALKEGDILAKNLIRRNGRLIFEEPNLRSFNDKRIVLSALNAGGLEKRDIALIKRLGVARVELKKSIPFVPVFTLGLVLIFALEMLLY